MEPPGKVEVLLVVVHLASKLYRNETDQTALAGRVRVDIEEAEARRQHCRTVVVGDFNMNPFESGVVGSEAFHAVMCREVASKGSREVAGQERFFFYNPMWSLFGDRSVGPPGTYHYNSGAVDNYYWNMFDQVLLRPGLITRFIDEDLLIVTEVDGRSLLTARGLPDKNVGSDHLPIMFGLNLL